jgi:hypothetical protein
MLARAVRNGYLYEYDDTINMIDWINGRGFKKLGPIDPYGANTARVTERLRAQCDCCEQYVARDQITRCWAYGIETYACDACRGVPPDCRIDAGTGRVIPLEDEDWP